MLTQLQIQSLLSETSFTSVSQIITFILTHLSKTIQQTPYEQILYRLQQLQKPKGLDSIMIEEVKTIAEAMLDQREENIRFDFDKALNQHISTIQTIADTIHYDKNQRYSINHNHNHNHNNNGHNQRNSIRNQRHSLVQMDILNLMNTISHNNNNNNNHNNNNNNTSFNTQKNYKHIRQSFKQNNFTSQSASNLLMDYQKVIQKLQNDKKQLNQLKYSILQINKQISNKITLPQTQSIIQSFESRIYKNLQKDKSDIQKMQYNIKKQIQQELFQFRKQIMPQINNNEDVQCNINTIKKNIQKINKKLQKYTDQTKNISKLNKSLSKNQQQIANQIISINNKINQYMKFNDNKNQDIQLILQDINQKFTSFAQIHQLKQQIHKINKINTKSCCWLTQSKTKNQQLIWEKEIIDSKKCDVIIDSKKNQCYKFQKEKSQILINQPGIYQVSFMFLQNKQSLITGCAYLNSDSTKKQVKLVGNNTLVTLIEITQKTYFSLKVNQSNLGGKGILRISRY